MSTVVTFQEREVKSYNSVKFIELIILSVNVLLSAEIHWYPQHPGMSTVNPPEFSFKKT